jgi:hypothetical protein
MTDQNPNIDHLWEHFKQKVHDIMNEFIPTKMINNFKRKLPWFYKEIRKTFLGGLTTFLGFKVASMYTIS